MSFTNPLMFLWLGVAAPIVALYFLKLRRRKIPVSSTWLWARSIQDLRVNAPFQKLRKSLLLLLQLLLVALAAFALAGPVGRASPPDQKRWVFILDRSASMQMTDVEPSRLGMAKKLAKEILSGTGSGDEVMVIAFANRAQVLTPFTSNHPAVERAIDAIEPSDAPTRAEEAFRIAASALQTAAVSEIVVLSDGRFEAIRGMPAETEIRYIAVGAEPRNAALTALDVRRPKRTDDPWSIFAHVDLFHGTETEVPVELYLDGRLRSIKRVTIPPNEGGAVIFEIYDADPSVVHLVLDYEDDLAADNRAWFVVQRDRARIMVASAGNYFLEKAVANLRDIDAVRATEVSAATLGEADVVVLDGIMPEALPEGRYLVFGGVPPWEGIKATEMMEYPVVADWDRRHPVTRRLELGELSIKSAPRLELPGFARPIVEAADAPLIFTWEKGRTRAVVVTFPLLESDWPLRLSFPLFVSQAVEWLLESEKTQVQPGEPLRVTLGDEQREAEVVTPGGDRHVIAGEPGRTIHFGGTERAGLYMAGPKDDARPVAVNLLDPQESAGRVEKELRIDTGAVKATETVVPDALPYWPWLASAALVLIFLEWLVYHRRLAA